MNKKLEAIYQAASFDELAGAIEEAMDTADHLFANSRITEGQFYRVYNRIRSAKRHMNIRLKARREYSRRQVAYMSAFV